MVQLYLSLIYIGSNGAAVSKFDIYIGSNGTAVSKFDIYIGSNGAAVSKFDIYRVKWCSCI